MPKNTPQLKNTQVRTRAQEGEQHEGLIFQASASESEHETVVGEEAAEQARDFFAYLFGEQPESVEFGAEAEQPQPDKQPEEQPEDQPQPQKWRRGCLSVQQQQQQHQQQPQPDEQPDQQPEEQPQQQPKRKPRPLWRRGCFSMDQQQQPQPDERG